MNCKPRTTPRNRSPAADSSWGLQETYSLPWSQSVRRRGALLDQHTADRRRHIERRAAQQQFDQPITSEYYLARPDVPYTEHHVGNA
ncbi:MAG: hypothetical protein EXR98_06310 [Gemmataceae bacterium]|nr:hypothetical protein [Gemmataceae bacterium]